MIKALLVEDEPYARKELLRLLARCEQHIEVVAELDSVKAAVEFLRTKPALDLLFFDIQLADGLSFEIFDQVEVNLPVIFTTAYDQFTLKAFKLLSVDYLLKPIEPDQLQQALDKFETAFVVHDGKLSDEYRDLARQVLQKTLPEYKKRFLGRVGHKVIRVNTADIAYFCTEDQITWLVTKEQRLAVEHSLDQLEDLLDPEFFFRINRQMIVQVEAIQRMERYGSSQWMLVLQPEAKDRVLVSRGRSAEFIAWMDR
jgi:DNA-binding LytR/AlgR family response regulator